MKATFYVADGPDYLGNGIFTAQVFSNGLKNYFFLFAELRRQLAARNIALDTQDITPVEEADLVVAIDQVAFFQTYQRRPGQRLYLVMNEPSTYFPEVWRPENHAVFDRVFTYDYTLTGPKYTHYTFALDLEGYPPLQEVSEAEFKQRRLLLLLAGVVDFNRPKAGSSSLLHVRYQSLRWFGKHWPQQFDFFSRGIEEKVYRSFTGLGVLRRVLPSFLAEGLADLVAARRRRAIARISQGPVPPFDKQTFIRRYRFVLCYENTAQAGYVSEKIFDCLFAGVVPVYLGEPEIGRVVPPACFIDRRAFTSDAALAEFLQQVTFIQYRQFLAATQQFLCSDGLHRFSATTNAGLMADTIMQDMALAGESAAAVNPGSDE